MINLSQFVDKQVKIIYQNGQTNFGMITLADKVIKKYKLHLPSNTRLTYFEDGTNWYQVNEYNIVKIELVEYIPTKPTNKLDPKTWHTIASALTPEAIKYIQNHEKYAEVMITLIEEFVDQNVGNTDGELPFMIFDRIFLNKNSN